MITSFARVRTRRAKDYLCFLNGVAKRNGSSQSDGDAYALIQLQDGICEIAAGEEFLDISITASSVSHAATLEDFVSERLDDVAGVEELQYQWIMAPERPMTITN